MERPDPAGWRRRREAGLGLLCAALAALLGPAPATAAVVEGVTFADRLAGGEGGAELRLHGVALLRYRMFFRAYVAALYLPQGVPGARALSADVPRRLEISYFWPIDAEDFGRAADALLTRQLDPEELARLRQRLEVFHAAYRPVRPGSRYALTYSPGVGTELSLDGVPLVSVPGADFAAAYFGIWLAEREPLDAGLRGELLGGGTE